MINIKLASRDSTLVRRQPHVDEAIFHCKSNSWLNHMDEAVFFVELPLICMCGIILDQMPHIFLNTKFICLSFHKNQFFLQQLLHILIDSRGQFQFESDINFHTISGMLHSCKSFQKWKNTVCPRKLVHGMATFQLSILE